MKKFKRFLAVIVCVAVLLGSTPLGGFVGLDLPSLFDFKAEAASSGTCGTNLQWTLNTDTGVLNITGIGAMTDWQSSKANWYSYRSNIKTVNIESGVTTIGDCAFSECGNLTSVTIPDSITTIGDYAFIFCSNLTNITMPDNITSIGEGAFLGCNSLTNITIPDSVTSIAAYAFESCSNLTSVKLGNRVITVGNCVFNSCYNLTNVIIPHSVETIGYAAFNECYLLADVYYTGSAQQWNKISIGESNGSLTSATIHFDTYKCDHPEDKLNWHTVVEPTCVPGIEEAVCSECGFTGTEEIVCDSSTYPNGTHDYGINTNKTWKFSYPGADKLILHFSYFTQTEAMRDFIYIYDSIGAEHGRYSADELKNAVIELQGDSFSIKLTTNDQYFYYGFSFNSIVAVIYNEDLLREIPTIDGHFHDWSNKDGVCARGCGATCTHPEDKKAWTEVVAPTCIPGKENSVCSVCGYDGFYKVLCDSLTYPRCDIRDAEFVDKTWGFSYPGAEKLILNFSRKTSIYDDLYIYNGNGDIVGHYTGSQLSDKTVEVDGDSFKLRIVAEYMNYWYGFSFNSIIAVVSFDEWTRETPAVHNWNSGICKTCEINCVKSLNSTVIDNENYTIYGLAAGADSLDEYATPADSLKWTYKPGQYGFGTGTVATLKDGSKTVAEYTVVIFGDIDGNGWYDANDAFLVRMISNGLIDKSVLSSAAQRAADCNHDGLVNELDFEILNNASVLLDNIDQSATQAELETNSVYIEYMSLIDQSAGVETEDTTPEANEVVGEFDIEAIFAKIFEFIRKIFAFVLSVAA